MAWTWEEIETDWLEDGRVADEPGDVVAAFEQVEASFGRQWIERSRVRRAVMSPAAPPAVMTERGSLPVLRVVAMGRLLASLEGIPGTERMIRKLRKGDRAAEAEATAIRLLRARSADSIVELEPVVSIPDQADRRADFRVRRSGEPWTYVEVSATDRAATEREAHRLIEELTQTITTMRGSFLTELYFINLPDDTEVQAIRRRIIALQDEPNSLIEELPNRLGVVRWDKDCNPAEVRLKIENIPYRPELGRAYVRHADGEVRSIAVRLPYADARGRKKLRKESSQLPENQPGLLMIDTGGAPGSHHSWEPAIQQDLAERRWVGAVFLFSSSMHADDQQRESISLSGRLIMNPSARRSLPSWVVDRLSALPDL